MPAISFADFGRSNAFGLLSALLVALGGLLPLSGARADVPFVASWNSYTDCRTQGTLIPTKIYSSGHSSCLDAYSATVTLFDANCGSPSYVICTVTACPAGSSSQTATARTIGTGGLCNSVGGTDVTCPGSAPQYNATTGEWTCPSAAFARFLALGYPPSQCPTGQCQNNPVNPAVGNKFEREVDYVGPGPFPLQFVRFYNSLGEPGDLGAVGEISGRLGRNWTHNYNRRLRFGGATITRVTAQRPDGKMLPFEQSGAVFVSNPNINEVLTKTATGWTLLNLEDELETYDSTGHLVSITNRSGLTQTLAYNTNGFVSTVTDPVGRTLSFTYGALDRIDVITLPGGSTLSYTYTAPHIAGISELNSLLSVVYPDGKVRGYSYTSVNPPSKFPYLLTGITDENGAAYATFAYTTTGLVTSTEHAGGAGRLTVTNSTATPTRTVTVTRFVSASQSATRSYTFTSKFGMAISTAISGPDCPSCGPKSTTSDANGNPTVEIDWNNNRTNYGYDTVRNLQTSRTEGLTAAGASTPQTRTITTEWHPTFRLVKRVAEPLRLTTYVYNGDGGVTCGAAGAMCSKTEQATTDANGSAGFGATPAGTPRVWSYTYNANGQVLTVDGPRTDAADVTTYTYYANNDADPGKRGTVATITNALGQTTQIAAYNAHGQPLTIVDPNGLTTTLAYDLRQRLTSRTVGTETTSYTYDNAGQLIKVTLPDGSFLSYGYDNAHRLTSIQDNLGNRIAYTLDFVGNRTLEQVFDPSNALAQTRSRVYSNINRLFQELGALSQTTEYGYDSQGNVTSVKDPLNHITANQYDALNRLKQVTDPNLGVTQYGYNALDALTQVTDPRSLVTGYTVDGLGNLTLQASPDTGSTTSTYDAAGNLLTQTDAKGQGTTYVYDALSRVSLITFHDGSKQSYAYDQGSNGIGRLSSITETNPSSVTTSLIAYGYDQRGRVTSETRTVNGIAYVLAYSYDSSGRLTGMTYPSGRTVTYALDALGRVSQVTTTKDSQSQVVVQNVAYHPFGGAKSWTLGNGQIYSRTVDTDGRIASYTLGAANNTIGFDAASRITGIGANTYGYDNLDRLTSAVLPSANFAYGYDAAGNRLTKTTGASTDTYSYSGTSNRIATLTPFGSPARNFVFDANGSTTNDGLNTYAYDPRGRMVSATNGSSLVTSYQVNALGQRIRKTNANEDRVFTYDTWGKLIVESDPGGAPRREYIYLGDIPVGVVQ